MLETLQEIPPQLQDVVGAINPLCLVMVNRLHALGDAQIAEIMREAPELKKWEKYIETTRKTPQPDQELMAQLNPNNFMGSLSATAASE